MVEQPTIRAQASRVTHAIHKTNPSLLISAKQGVYTFLGWNGLPLACAGEFSLAIAGDREQTNHSQEYPQTDLTRLFLEECVW
jgi:hypothetical protein